MTLPPTPDLDALLEQVRRQQEQVADVQRSVEALEIRGASRGDEVSVTLRGTGQFTDVTFHGDTLRRYGATELGDIVLEAVNDGLVKLAEASRARFAPFVDPAAEQPDPYGETY
ncbi:YbaB/EbfC family nucleoid-associated protein [Jatrophihabitans sp. YIM 134969]